MNTATLLRTYHSDHTRGVLFVTNDIGTPLFICAVLELPWRDNARKVSCIPEGDYQVKRRWSRKHQWHYHILDVPDRDSILQHPGNYTHQIEGCQLPGNHFEHLNSDGVPDIANTRLTLNNLMRILGEEYTLTIRSFGEPTHQHAISPAIFWKK